MELLELYQLTGRLRRQFPRVQDVLDVCDELQHVPTGVNRDSQGAPQERV
jgi:hypothetical protein